VGVSCFMISVILHKIFVDYFYEMITQEQINKILDKFFHEHRVAWDELVKIERIENLNEKTQKALELYDTELLPHFKKEEETILSEKEFPEYVNDEERIQILDEHQKTYKTIDELKNNKDIQKNLDAFFPLMKSHIKLEDKYFGKIKDQLTNTLRTSASNIEPVLFVVIGVIFLGLVVWVINKNN